MSDITVTVTEYHTRTLTLPAEEWARVLSAKPSSSPLQVADFIEQHLPEAVLARVRERGVPIGGVRHSWAAQVVEPGGGA